MFDRGRNLFLSHVNSYCSRNCLSYSIWFLDNNGWPVYFVVAAFEFVAAGSEIVVAIKKIFSRWILSNWFIQYPIFPNLWDICLRSLRSSSYMPSLCDYLLIYESALLRWAELWNTNILEPLSCFFTTTLPRSFVVETTH